jgi:hypothetical protein
MNCQTSPFSFKKMFFLLPVLPRPHLHVKRLLLSVHIIPLPVKSFLSHVMSVLPPLPLSLSLTPSSQPSRDHVPLDNSHHTISSGVILQ